jgi:ADP-ribose pyrophosphatase
MGLPVEKSEWIYRGRAVALRADTVRLPNGKETRLEIIEHTGSVVLVPVDAMNAIWFVRQYRHATGGELLELPAGTVEPGEQPAACASRELREEIGMSANEIEHLGAFYLAPGYSTEYMHVYLARDLRIDPLPGDEDEILKPEKFSWQDVQKMLREGVFQDAKTITALTLAFSHLSISGSGV